MLIHNPADHKFRILAKIYKETCLTLSGNSANLSYLENSSELDFCENVMSQSFTVIWVTGLRVLGRCSQLFIFKTLLVCKFC